MVVIFIMYFFTVLVIKKYSNEGFPNTNEMIELTRTTFSNKDYKSLLFYEELDRVKFSLLV